MGDQDLVGRRQFRGPEAVEHEHRFDYQLAHLPEWFLRARARNSSSAWATTAEIDLPDARACSRTCCARRDGTLTVNTVVGSGTATAPDWAATAT